MRVLVVGSGAREHALCAHLVRFNPNIELYCAAGNPGVADVASLVSLSEQNTEEIAEWAQRNEIELVIVGPELPLSLGLADALEEKGIRVFGPSAAAATLEASKTFAKEIMSDAGVATARFTLVHSEAELFEQARDFGFPVVLKADGLAAGKGVSICRDEDELATETMRIFALKGSKSVLIEEFLEGEEASFIVAASGRHFVTLATSHDYKRLLDHDEGPNTGGMGAVAPTPRLSEEDITHVAESVISPVLTELERRTMPFRGFLYAGLMKSNSGEISVVEFNVRLGDPEAQAILALLDEDLLSITSELEHWPHEQLWRRAQQRPGFAVNTVLAARGYPAFPEKGAVIAGFAHIDSETTKIFQAGTSLRGTDLVVQGGRVLSALGLGETLENARMHSQHAATQIEFEGRHFRRDIGTEVK